MIFSISFEINICRWNREPNGPGHQHRKWFIDIPGRPGECVGHPQPNPSLFGQPSQPNNDVLLSPKKSNSGKFGIFIQDFLRGRVRDIDRSPGHMRYRLYQILKSFDWILQLDPVFKIVSDRLAHPWILFSGFRSDLPPIELAIWILIKTLRTVPICIRISNPFFIPAKRKKNSDSPSEVWSPQRENSSSPSEVFISAKRELWFSIRSLIPTKRELWFSIRGFYPREENSDSPSEVFIPAKRELWFSIRGLIPTKRELKFPLRSSSLREWKRELWFSIQAYLTPSAIYRMLPNFDFQ